MDRSGIYCFDSTHATNDTDSQVYTLMWMGNNHEGVPVATFTVHADHDHHHVEACLRWVLKYVPGWTPFCFMTDDAPMCKFWGDGGSAYMCECVLATTHLAVYVCVPCSAEGVGKGVPHCIHAPVHVSFDQKRPDDCVGSVQ